MLNMEFAALFLKRRIVPVQFRIHQMWLYTGSRDSTRISPASYTEKEL